MGPHAERQLLESLGLQFEILDSGCCGMAGAFGFERGDHYEVSVKCGERVLLPKVREANDDTLIITDGFSCREQIQQLTTKKPMHVAEVLRMAIHEGQEVGMERIAREKPEVADGPLTLTLSPRRGEGTKGRPDLWVRAGVAALTAAGCLLWKRRGGRLPYQQRRRHEEPSHK